MEARTRGLLTLVLSTLAYTYYSAWLLLVPFIEEDQPARKLFPPPYYALAPVALGGSLLVAVTLITLGCFIAGPELRKLVSRRKPKSS